MKAIARLVICLLTLPCFAQTATLKFLAGFGEAPNGYNTEFSLAINGKIYNVTDSIHQTINLSKKGLDKCSAIIGKDTLHFVAKFRKGETYIVRPGCCCAFFTLEPENNPKRGTISFKNKTKENLLIIAAEANNEEVAPGKTKTEFTYESAMCMFKPCSIVIAKTDYNDPKYDYHNDGRDYDILWKEQGKYVVDSTFFHFMHGEKISVVLDNKGEMTIKLDGYLSPEENLKF